MVPSVPSWCPEGIGYYYRRHGAYGDKIME